MIDRCPDHYGIAFRRVDGGLSGSIDAECGDRPVGWCPREDRHDGGPQWGSGDTAGEDGVQPRLGAKEGGDSGGGHGSL